MHVGMYAESTDLAHVIDLALCFQAALEGTKHVDWSTADSIDNPRKRVPLRILLAIMPGFRADGLLGRPGPCMENFFDHLVRQNHETSNFPLVGLLFSAFSAFSHAFSCFPLHIIHG
jgi:hypothetical protein